MFRDIKETKLMIQGAYRKLKSYYYYNKNFLIMRKKISDFECDPEAMEASFEQLAFALCHPVKSKEYISKLLESIDFFVIPKKFEAESILILS